MIITVTMEHTTSWDLATLVAEQVDSRAEDSEWPPESAIIHGVKALAIPVGTALYIRRRYRPRPASDDPSTPDISGWGVWDRKCHKWILDPKWSRDRKSALAWISQTHLLEEM